MRLCLAVVCVLISLFSVAAGQWFETTIPMPQPPQALSWNSTGNKIYCAVGDPGAYGAVTVIDGATNLLLDTAMLDCQMPGGICADAVHNRIYCAGSSYYPLDESLVTAIDGSVDTVMARIAVGGAPLAMCTNPVANKLYCASQLANQIAIIDGATYSVLKVLSVPSWPIDMLYAPELNRVYCVEQGPRNSPNFMVTVIDGTSDSILRTIFVGHYARSICYNRTDAKIYTANGFDGNVSVVDANTNTVIATVTVGGAPSKVFWNPYSDRVYCSDEGSGTLWVIDGVTNQLCSTLPLVGAAHSMCLDSAAGKVYCSNFLDSVVTVIDARRDSIVKTIATGPDPECMCYNWTSGRTYVGCRGDNKVYVIKDSVVGGVEEKNAAPCSRRPAIDFRPNPCDGVLYLEAGPPSSYDQTIRLYDVQGSVVADLQPGANDIRHLVPGTYFLAGVGCGRTTKLVVR
jgi:YVTN family beta-propeller protein